MSARWYTDKRRQALTRPSVQIIFGARQTGVGGLHRRTRRTARASGSQVVGQSLALRRPPPAHVSRRESETHETRLHHLPLRPPAAPTRKGDRAAVVLFVSAPSTTRTKWQGMRCTPVGSAVATAAPSWRARSFKSGSTESASASATMGAPYPTGPVDAMPEHFGNRSRGIQKPETCLNLQHRYISVSAYENHRDTG